MKNANLEVEERFAILRVALESRFSGPMQIVVCSAVAEDRSDAVARGLARSFVAAGRSTALISLGDVVRKAVDVRDAMRETKKLNDVTVVDGGSPSSSSACLSAAAAADAVLLAVALGRPLVADDAELVPSLARVQARVVGVVTVNAATLAAAESLDRLSAPDIPAVELPRPVAMKVV